MAVLGAAIITFAVGEIWWFFLRGNPGTETVQELLPPPQELQPLLPLEEITAIPTEEVSLPALLAYNRTENIESPIKDNIDYLNINPDEIVRLIVKKPDISGSTVSEPYNFINLTQDLGLKMPLSISQTLSDEFDLFIFGGNTFDKNECRRAQSQPASCYGPRLGLAVKTTDSIRLAAALRIWEKTMVTDLKGLVLSKIGNAATPGFQTGNYQGQIIRYKNLPLNTVTVEYVLAGDVLIITTSKNSILKALDALTVTEEPILYESE